MQCRKKQFEIILSIFAIGAMISAAHAKEPFWIESEVIFANNFHVDGLCGNSEYLRDHRIGEFFSRSCNSSNEGNELDTSPGIGSAFAGLDSAYEIQWYGIWIGEHLHATSKDLQAFPPQIEVLLNIENSGTDFSAEADWNLMSDFTQLKDFKQQADGNAFDLSTGLNIFFTPNLALNLDYSYQDWYTGEGRDPVYFEKGSKMRTQLNEVNWESHAIGIGILFNF